MMRVCRVALGLSQQTWADLLGVHTVTVARWEEGTRVPSKQTRRFVMELMRRGDFRARLHQQPDIEQALLVDGLVPKLEWLIESMAHLILLLVSWDGLSPTNRLVLERLLDTARAELSRRPQLVA